MEVGVLGEVVVEVVAGLEEVDDDDEEVAVGGVAVLVVLAVLGGLILRTMSLTSILHRQNVTMVHPM
jgi:hypothetical protein